MIVFRISDCGYINDLSGTGAALYGARWNSRKTYMLYTAQSASLALLEAVVHIGKLPAKSFCLAKIELPDSIAPAILPTSLPPDWHSNPSPDSLKKIGDDFIGAGKYLALPVPSVVMMEENNYLINPHHPLAAGIKVLSVAPVRMDERIFKA